MKVGLDVKDFPRQGSIYWVEGGESFPPKFSRKKSKAISNTDLI